MAKTRTLSISFGTYSAIKATDPCTTAIIVSELASVASWPTTDLLIAMPSATDTPIQIPGGVRFTFQKPRLVFYQPGEVAGYVSPAANPSTTTLAIEEQSAP